jgi:hypothetical protein
MTMTEAPAITADEQHILDGVAVLRGYRDTYYPAGYADMVALRDTVTDAGGPTGAAFDRAVTALAVRREIRVIPEDAQGRLSRIQRESAVRIGGCDYHHIDLAPQPATRARATREATDMTTPALRSWTTAELTDALTPLIGTHVEITVEHTRRQRIDDDYVWWEPVYRTIRGTLREVETRGQSVTLRLWDHGPDGLVTGRLDLTGRDHPIGSGTLLALWPDCSSGYQPGTCAEECPVTGVLRRGY